MLKPHPPHFITHSYTHTQYFCCTFFDNFIHTASPSAVPKFIFMSFLVFISFQYVVIRICFAYFSFICFSNLRYILRSHIYAYTHILNYCKNDILYAIWYADNNRSSKFHENTSHRFLKKRKLCKDGVLGKYTTPSLPPLFYFFSTSSTSRLSRACILISIDFLIKMTDNGSIFTFRTTWHQTHTPYLTHNTQHTPYKTTHTHITTQY